MKNQQAPRSAASIKIRIKARAGEPASTQVADQLEELIASGRLKAGETMPSEDALAGHLGVGRKIVRTAYAKLVEQGLLIRDFPRNKRVAGPASKGTAQFKKSGHAKQVPAKKRAASRGRAGR